MDELTDMEIPALLFLGRQFVKTIVLGMEGVVNVFLSCPLALIFVRLSRTNVRLTY